MSVWHLVVPSSDILLVELGFDATQSPQHFFIARAAADWDSDEPIPVERGNGVDEGVLVLAGRDSSPRRSFVLFIYIFTAVMLRRYRTWRKA